ncbi:MAG: polymer-forming cytoskeletal protein [bacterium]
MNFRMITGRKLKKGVKYKASKISPPISGDIDTILGKETTFKGILTYDGTVKIDGKVEGEILAKDTLIIGEDAEINAEIRVGRIISRGKIKGNIFVKERAEFLAPAVVQGNIQTPILVIEDGVTFDGKCDMGAVAKNVKKPELKITALHQEVVKARAGD